MKDKKINGKLKEIDGVMYVPYIIFELNQITNTFIIKLLAIIVVISMLITAGVVGLATYERLQYDHSSTASSSEVNIDGKDGVANYIGNDGDIVNGENNSKENHEDKITPP